MFGIYKDILTDKAGWSEVLILNVNSAIIGDVACRIASMALPNTKIILRDKDGISIATHYHRQDDEKQVIL